MTKSLDWPFPGRKCTYCLSLDVPSHRVCDSCAKQTGPPRTWPQEASDVCLGPDGIGGFPHTIPELGRPSAPIPPPAHPLPVPEGRGWLNKKLGCYLKAARRPDGGPPPYEVIEKDARDATQGTCPCRCRCKESESLLRSTLGQAKSKVVLPIQKLWRQERDLVREFQQWRRERDAKEAIEADTSFKLDKGKYKYVIGFEDSGPKPNWRAKLEMVVRDPTKETSWLAPLDQDVPRWIWESYRLPDDWYDANEPPSFKCRGGQTTAYLVGVSRPQW